MQILDLRLFEISLCFVLWFTFREVFPYPFHLLWSVLHFFKEGSRDALQYVLYNVFFLLTCILVDVDILLLMKKCMDYTAQMSRLWSHTPTEFVNILV